MVQVIKNPFSKRILYKGTKTHQHSKHIRSLQRSNTTKTHQRMKYLRSLRRLNTINLKIRSGKGRAILVFGRAHINYLYNNYSLTDQNKLISDFKKISQDVRKDEIKGLSERHQDVKTKFKNDVKYVQDLDEDIMQSKVEKLCIK